MNENDIPNWNLSDLKKVKVKMAHDLEVEYLCIDQGEGVWGEQGEVFQAHTVRLVRRPNSPYTPKWQDIVSKEYYVSHEIIEGLLTSEN